MLLKVTRLTSIACPEDKLGRNFDTILRIKILPSAIQIYMKCSSGIKDERAFLTVSSAGDAD